MPVPDFKVHAPFEPAGDQPQAIDAIVAGFESGLKQQTLLGITGSGKTYSVAKVVERLQQPTLVMSHNKTLAAQLYSEFREFFPDNAVEYFVSYYDYYQPEAYIPQSDTYISKETNLNADLEKKRHSTTRSLMTRDDVLVVSSVSCIYGLGSPRDYRYMGIPLRVGGKLERKDFLRRLVDMQYSRTNSYLERGKFRATGDTIDIYPPGDDDVLRIELFGDEIERISTLDPLKASRIADQQAVLIYPASHYVVSAGKWDTILDRIKEDLEIRLAELKAEQKYLEIERLERQTKFDLEMMWQTGWCAGIENYSFYLGDRKLGDAPECLIDFFPDDFLTVIDESHQTLPQVRGMYNGDRSRKQTLVHYGFRLPTAMENRPQRYDEYWSKLDKALFVSATPGDEEIERSGGAIIEQIIRPTGLPDPLVVHKPSTGQVDDLLEEVRTTVEAGDRVLVTTLTKQMAEDLTEYYATLGVRVNYLHSDIETLERVEILRDLQNGRFDVLVGINLLREGLDLPQVGLVGILDAHKSGFLRNERSLIQTIGRASRNVHGRVILYGDEMTDAMQSAIDLTMARRERQLAYNKEHGITPRTVKSRLHRILEPEEVKREPVGEPMEASGDFQVYLSDLEQEMHDAAERLDFEMAAKLRDRIRILKEKADA